MPPEPAIKSTRTDLPSLPALLERKPKNVNLLVGNQPAQVRFAETYLSAHFLTPIICQEVELVTDESVQGLNHLALFRVDRISQVELSPKVRPRVGIWGLSPINRGSDGANAIVRFAAALLKREKLPFESIKKFADELVRLEGKLSLTREVDEIIPAIWSAVWLLGGAVPEGFIAWPQPWNDPLKWLPKNIDPNLRLNTLYWDLVSYVFAREGDEAALKKLRRFKAHDFKQLSRLKLPGLKVEQSVQVLSQWRADKSNPHICALQIARIWQR